MIVAQRIVPNGGLVTLYLVVYLKFDDGEGLKKVTYVLTIRNIHNINLVGAKWKGAEGCMEGLGCLQSLKGNDSPRFLFCHIFSKVCLLEPWSEKKRHAFFLFCEVMDFHILLMNR